MIDIIRNILMKKYLAIFFISSLSCLIYAQDFADVNYQFPQFLPLNTASLSNSSMHNLTPMAAENTTNYPSNFFGALGCGLLNIFFGLGSYLSNDWQGGTIIAVWQGLGVAGTIAFGWEDLKAGTFFDGWDGVRWNNAKLGLMIGGGLGLATGSIGWLYGPSIEGLLLIPLFAVGGGLFGGIIGFCVKPGEVEYTSENMKWAMFSVGFWAFGAIIGIISPLFALAQQEEKTAQLNDPRNWNIGLVPTEDGRLAGHISFTAHFF